MILIFHLLWTDVKKQGKYWKMLGMSQKIVANEDCMENANVAASDDGTL